MRSLVTSLLMSCLFYAHAQDNNCDQIWKKKVSRIISLTSKGKNSEKSILRTIIEDVKKGNINVYRPITNDSVEKMPINEFGAIFDTVKNYYSVTDPLTAQQRRVVSTSIIDPDDIQHYKLIEEWTYNTGEGKINGRILWVSPRLDIYTDDGKYRGSRSLFTISYKEFCNFMKREHSHELQEFTDTIWRSFFTADSDISFKRNGAGELQAMAVLTANLKEPEDTAVYFLNDENDISQLSELIYDNARNSKMPAWRTQDTILLNRLTTEQLHKIIPLKIDSTVVVDPVSGQEKMITTQRGIHFDQIHLYQISAKYFFNPTEGVTTIHFKQLGMISDEINSGINDYTPVFWVNYKDVQPIVTTMATYQPENIFAIHAWQSFFLSPANLENGQ